MTLVPAATVIKGPRLFKFTLSMMNPIGVDAAASVAWVSACTVDSRNPFGYSAHQRTVTPLPIAGRVTAGLT